jgi:hypothetical protein
MKLFAIVLGGRDKDTDSEEKILKNNKMDSMKFRFILFNIQKSTAFIDTDSNLLDVILI